MGRNKRKGNTKEGKQSKHSGSILIAGNVNQTKPDESVSNAAILPDNYHDTAPAQNHHSGAPSISDSQSVGVPDSDVDQEKGENLEENCVELQEEINKLEDNIWSHKELYKDLQGSLEERITLLQNEVDSCILKEASLEEKIVDLQSKIALLMTREGSLEEKIQLLQNETDSCVQKEANLEEIVKKMEEMNHSFALEESIIKEVLSRLGGANEGLQMQVMELKDSGDSLARENRQLTDIISTLESRIQHLEMIASSKASLIHEEPVQLAGICENPSNEHTMKNPSTVKPSSTSAEYASDFHENTLESNGKIETMEERFNVDGAEEDSGSMDESQRRKLLGLDDSGMNEDIVEELEEPADEKMEEDDEPVAVPLSDAPLIGAPFRLVSFVARFVSGADLVDRRLPKPCR